MSARWLAVFAVALLGAQAQAHWCHDIFASSYNIVVRPEADTVSVPSSGAATLSVYVQNNLGYPLQGFTLAATASGYTINISRQAPKVANYLMPGEKLRHTLSISRAGGASLPVEGINFYVRMGTGAGDQSRCYGNPGCGSTPLEAAVIKKTTGATSPVGPIAEPSLANAWDQAEHLRYAAQSDFGDLNQGIDNLLTTYCVGRTTWGYQTVDSACCPNSSTTICPPASCNGNGAWSSLSSNDAGGPDGPHLWAAGELAIRKSALGATRLATFRDRLRCSWSDPWLLMRGYAAFVLGYLGEDAQARTFLEGIISSASTSASDKTVAKAALLLFKSPADLTAYRADVTTGASSSDPIVAYLCAAALGIADQNDAIVTSVLIPQARWSYPFDGNDPRPVFAGQLLNLVAWDRRGWSVSAGDTGQVCFYESCGTPDTTNPRPPAGATCVASPGGGVRVSWSQVTLDVNGGAENVSQYRVYSGTSPRPGGCSRPASCGGFDYANVDSGAAVFRDFSALDGAQTYYFSVTAVDAAGNASDYSLETSCRPQYAPVARINCVPTSGTAPLQVTCDADQSTDQNGPSDALAYSFRLDAQAWQTQNPVTFDFASAGGHTVQLQVTDSTGLSSTASATISVSATGGNQPPVAQASATPTQGPAPLTVSFSSAGSSDPDTGQILSYQWSFDDGSAPSTAANPSHTFSAAGSYSVLLTVTDDGTPPLSSTAMVAVTAAGNLPPDVQPATMTPQTGVAPLLVQYDATGVSDPEGDAISLSWDFGDSSAASTSPSGSHTFAQPGTYTVVLLAQDDGLPAVAPARKEFIINVTNEPLANRPPDCSAATVTPASGTAPLSLTLDASGCVDPDGDSLTYLWRVPITMVSEESFNTATATYVVTQPRTLSVELTVSDDAASPMEVSRSFPVVVTAGQVPEVTGASCGCSAAAAPWELWALVAGAVGLLRRRRS